LRERLRGGLQTSLNRFSRDFNTEISAAARAIVPNFAFADARSVESAIPENFERWKRTTRRSQIFARIALAIPVDSGIDLEIFNQNSRAFEHLDWPDSWRPMRNRLESITEGEMRGGRGRGVPGECEGLAFEVPLFANGSHGGRDGQPG